MYDEKEPKNQEGESYRGGLWVRVKRIKDAIKDPTNGNTADPRSNFKVRSNSFGRSHARALLPLSIYSAAALSPLFSRSSPIGTRRVFVGAHELARPRRRVAHVAPRQFAFASHEVAKGRHRGGWWC